MNQMPKGADLHLHYTGALYAESFIAAVANNSQAFFFCGRNGTVTKSEAAALGDASCAWVRVNETQADGTFDTVVRPTLLQVSEGGAVDRCWWSVLHASSHSACH